MLLEAFQPTLDEGVPLSEVDFCVVDLETTGGSPHDAGITEIGAVRYRGGERLGTFESLVNPMRPIPRFVAHLTGIDDRMVRDAQEHESEDRKRREQVEALASVSYAPADMGAAISSGSFQTAGMIVAPCSAKTLAAIAHGYGDSLIHRAADVVLKERRRLVLSVREAPLSDIHLENMLKLSRMGAVILPPMPAFYHKPASLDDIVDHTVARMMDQFGIEMAGARRWTGEMGVGGED